MKTKHLWWLAAFIFALLFVGVVVLGLPWRWAIERRVDAIKARGEPTCLVDLKPKPVPADQDGGPQLEALWATLSSEPAWKDRVFYGRGRDCVAAIRFCLGKGEAPDFFSKLDKSKQAEWKKRVSDLEDLLKRRPDLLVKVEEALNKPHCQFKADYSQKTASFLRSWLGSIRNSLNAMTDLSLYYEATNHDAEAQRCRLLFLRFPRTLDEGPGILIDALVRVAVNGIANTALNGQFDLMNDEELRQLQKAADLAKPFPHSMSEMLKRERVFALGYRELKIDDLKASYGWFSPFGDRDQIWPQIQEKTFLYSGWRFYDYLQMINSYEDLIAGRPLGANKSYLWQLLGENMFPIRLKLLVESAKLRQLRLGIALELIKRRDGRYPADLKSLDLPQEGADGKPMFYQVIDGGRGACLEFFDKVTSKTMHFPLGDCDEKVHR